MAGILLLLSEIQTVPATDSTAVDFTWLFIKMLLVLGIVSVGAVMVLKFAVPRTGFLRKLNQNAVCEVLGRQSLEPGKALYLVKAGKRYMMLGASEHAITHVAEFSADEARELTEKS